MSPSNRLNLSPSLILALMLTELGGTAAAQIQTEQAKYTPFGVSTMDLFGRDLALSGNRVFASTTMRPSAGWLPTGARPGEVRVLDSTTGAQLGVLTASNGSGSDFFGSSLSSDGQLAIIGAAFSDGVSVDSGAAYVFDIQSLQEVSKLNATDGGVDDRLGTSVAISGNLALAGAPGDLNGNGSAYVFDALTGGQLRKLIPSAPVSGESFGSSVAIEGSLAVVAASNTLATPGAVYAFDSATGNQRFKLTPPAPLSGERFGSAVDIEGGLIIVGAPTVPSSNFATGSVYLFDGTTGVQVAHLKPKPSSYAWSFGDHLAADGGRVAIGAVTSCTSGWYTGSVFVFDLASAQLVTELIASHPMKVNVLSPVGLGSTAFSHGLSFDAGRIAVGAPADSEHGRWAGAVYLFNEAQPNTGQGGCYPTSVTPTCPCTSDVPSSGCGNSTFGGIGVGAILYAHGDAQIGNDSLTLSVSNLPAGATGLFLYGSEQSGAPLGAGILCVGNSLRLSVQTANDVGTLERTGLSANASAGQTLTYQFWYRDLASSCGTSRSNLSNSWTVAW